MLGNQEQKKDAGKRRWSLFPFKAAAWIVQVLEFGAAKYSPGGWKSVDNAKERYADAAQRHLAAYLEGEYFDQESGLPHLAHLGCNVVFLLHLDAPEANTPKQYGTVEQECLWHLSEARTYKQLVVDVLPINHPKDGAER